MDDARIPDFYDAAGPFRGVNAAGVVAWLAGTSVFFAAGSLGGTLPAIVVSVLSYIGLRRIFDR